MTKNEYLQLVKSELALIESIIQKKNSDYTSGSDNPFANFELAEYLDIATAETGLLIRICDKIQRVKSFLKTGSLQVKSESYKDSLRDIIGYCLLLQGIMEAKEKEQEFNETWTKADDLILQASKKLMVQDFEDSSIIMTSDEYDKYLQNNSNNKKHGKILENSTNVHFHKPNTNLQD